MSGALQGLTGFLGRYGKITLIFPQTEIRSPYGRCPLSLDPSHIYALHSFKPCGLTSWCSESILFCSCSLDQGLGLGLGGSIEPGLGADVGGAAAVGVASLVEVGVADMAWSLSDSMAQENKYLGSFFLFTLPFFKSFRLSFPSLSFSLRHGRNGEGVTCA